MWWLFPYEKSFHIFIEVGKNKATDEETVNCWHFCIFLHFMYKNILSFDRNRERWMRTWIFKNITTKLHKNDFFISYQTWSVLASELISSRKSYSTTRPRLSTNLWCLRHPAHWQEGFSVGQMKQNFLLKLIEQETIFNTETIRAPFQIYT